MLKVFTINTNAVTLDQVSVPTILQYLEFSFRPNSMVARKKAMPKKLKKKKYIVTHDLFKIYMPTSINTHLFYDISKNAKWSEIEGSKGWLIF